jgi:hypothetical protein
MVGLNDLIMLRQHHMKGFIGTLVPPLADSIHDTVPTLTDMRKNGTIESNADENVSIPGRSG